MPQIQQLIIPDCDLSGTTAELLLYAEDDFFAANGTPHMAGRYPNADWRYKFSCTISSRNLTIPAKTIDATTDSDKPNVKYHAILLDEFKVQQRFFLQSFKVPHDLGNSITWEQISIRNKTRQGLSPDEFLTVKQVSQLFRTLAYNQDFIDAISTNPALIGALVNDTDFIDSLVTNPVFISALTGNPIFIGDLLIALMASDIVSKPQNFALTNPLSGNLHTAWEASNSVFPFDHYILRLRIVED